MKKESSTQIIIAILGLVGAIAAAVIGAKWGKDNVTVVVQVDGKSVVLDDVDVQKMAEENEELNNKVSEYEKQIESLKSESEDLADKLGVANGELSDAPAIEFQNMGLSIDGEEKTINKENSCVSINGRQYYSKDFVNSLLPSDKTATEKGDMLYIGKIVKEKSNLLDRQLIDKESYIEIEENVKDTYGNMHDKAVVFQYGNYGITYNANREYSKLKCVLSVLDGESGGGIIQIESEQGILYTSKEVLSKTEPIVVDIPINQASSITIKQISEEWGYNMVTDAVLYNEE